MKSEVAGIYRAHPTRSLCYCFFAPNVYGVFLLAHSVRGESRISAQRQRSGCNNIPSFLRRTAPIARSFCEGFTQHNLHILVTTPFCCDRKASGICAKLRTVAASNNIDHAPQSLYCCLFAPHICSVVLRVHPVRGESHIQRNANREVATVLFTCE